MLSICPHGEFSQSAPVCFGAATERSTLSSTGNTVFGPGLTAVTGRYSGQKNNATSVDTSHRSIGRAHSEQRKQLSPVFSVRYIRDMIPTFNRVGQEVRSPCMAARGSNSCSPAARGRSATPSGCSAKRGRDRRILEPLFARMRGPCSPRLFLWTS